MAAALVALPVDDLLRSLSQGSITTLGPRWGVEAQLREIHHLLSSLQGYLPQAESKYPHGLELQHMIRELKDAVYDAEDLLEDLSLEEPLRLRDGKLRRLFRHIESCLFGWRMRRELRDIASRLRGLTGPLIDILHSIPLQAVPEVCEIPFVGRVNEKGKIIKFLLDGCSSSAVVYGGWGCGKTTFVQEVTKDSGVSGHFDVKIWVNVSAPFDTNRVAQEIFDNLKEEEDVKEGEVFVRGEHSIQLLARLLDCSKRYLFVLDDITVRGWDGDWWSSLRNLMEGGVVSSGSKILLVAASRIPLGGIHSVDIERMEWEDALELLRETASQGREGYHKFHHPKILQILQGNPRRIKAVGGYLSLQPPATAEVWSQSLDRHLSSPLLFHGGYPYGILTSPGVKRYNNLPPWIKRCFSLCYLFPRGHPINTRILAQLWISLGFIHSNNHDEDDRQLPLEDIAYHYLGVLLREELFRVKNSDTFGKVKSVTLHPHAQEFVPSIARWECLVYLIHSWDDSYAEQYARHRSIIDYWMSIWVDDLSNDKLRTFLHYVEDRTKLEQMYHHLILKLNSKRSRVRVLDLHNVKADVLPEVIWTLKHLRYLDLSGNTTLQMLPPTIIRLLNLQTLKLSGCSSLTELPLNMSNLSALRYLYIDGCWKLYCIPRGLCYLKYLNILTDFILPPDDSSKNEHSVGLTDLCMLNDLRGSLKIKNWVVPMKSSRTKDRKDC